MKYLQWAFRVTDNDQPIKDFHERLEENLVLSLRLGGKENFSPLTFIPGIIAMIIELFFSTVRELILSFNITLDDFKDTLINALPFKNYPNIARSLTVIIYLLWMGIKIPAITMQFAIGVIGGIIHALNRPIESFGYLRQLFCGEENKTSDNLKTGAISLVANSATGVGIYLNQASIISSVLGAMGLSVAAVATFKIVIGAALIASSFSLLGQLCKESQEIKTGFSRLKTAMKDWFSYMKKVFGIEPFPAVKITNTLASLDWFVIVKLIHNKSYKTAVEHLIQHLSAQNIQPGQETHENLSSIMLAITEKYLATPENLPIDFHACIGCFIINSIQPNQTKFTPSQKKLIENLYLIWPTLPQRDALPEKFWDKVSLKPNGSISTKINEGTFGKVESYTSQDTQYALKSSKEAPQQDNLAGHLFSFLNEIFMFIYLDNKNKKLAQMHQAYFTPLAIAMHLAVYDLSTFSRKPTMTPELALHFMQGIIKGLQYLHQQNILHRDLKPHNFLVLEDNSVAICDFGGTCISPVGTDVVPEDADPNSWTDYQKIMVSTPYYAALEVYVGYNSLKHSNQQIPRASKKSDITSVGLSCAEFFIKSMPYAKFPLPTRANLLLDCMQKGGDPFYPFITNRSTAKSLTEILRYNENQPSNFVNNIVRCWNTNPNERPTLETLAENIQEELTRLGPANAGDEGQSQTRLQNS